jgi:hypothetical protein
LGVADRELYLRKIIVFELFAGNGFDCPNFSMTRYGRALSRNSFAAYAAVRGEISP